MSVDTDCVVIQIGNSDDKLTQKEWSRFVSRTSEALQSYCLPIHFSGISFSGDPWQNACWIMELPFSERDDLADDVKKLAAEFKQDSIAVMIGRFEFFGASGLVKAPSESQTLKEIYSRLYKSMGKSGVPLLFVSTILDHFRRRIEADTTGGDPLKNRALMVEPSIDSQVLDVPYFATAKVIEALYKIGMLNEWMRVNCPVEDDCIIESNNRTELNEAVKDCCQCGRDHSEDTDLDIQGFYVLRSTKREGVK